MIESTSAAATLTATTKILVAEDADDLRDAIVLVLVEQGYQVRAVSDGHQVTLVFPEFNPDLVVLDMRMPKLSGADTCAIIRKTSNVPVIIFTSTNDEAEVRNAISKGASDFVLKSTGVSELTERIADHLSRTTTVQSTVKPSIVKTVSAAPAQQFATTTLLIDSDEKSRSVIKAVLTRLNQGVIEVSTAAEAITAFKKHRPDIVITEWSLPDMDAFKMLPQFKGRKNGRELLKLLMSARLSPEVQRKAHFAGITNFLYKPLDGAKVEIMVADCVRKAIRGQKRKPRKSA